MWIALGLIFLAAIFFATLTNHLPISGAFYIPGIPIIGNTWQVLHNPSKVFSKWAVQYGVSSFVIRLGTMPVLVVNSYTDVHELWISHSIALGSRPTLHTFHNVVSVVQGLTVGSTPAGDSYKRKKKCLSQHLSAQRVAEVDITDTIDFCSRQCLKYVLTSACQDRLFLKDAQYYVLSAALRLTYGVALDCHGADTAFADKVILTENRIIGTRLLVANYQDYIPFLRVWPFCRMFDAHARYWSNRRDTYMRELYSRFIDELNQGQELARRSMLAHILEEKFSALSLSEKELQSICLTMVSAGLDNTALTLDHLFGHLSQPKYGYFMQDKLYSDLLSASKNCLETAWKNVAVSTDCAYATALLLESLRYFSVLPLGLPRKTVKDLHFKGMYIPAKTIVLMNTYAANHDSNVFEHPFQFEPERWINEQGKLSGYAPHFSFGAGSRKCIGNHLATAEMYTLLCRTVLLFRIEAPQDNSYVMGLDPFTSNGCPKAMSFEPKEFRVSFRPRHGSRYTEHLLG